MNAQNKAQNLKVIVAQQSVWAVLSQEVERVQLDSGQWSPHISLHSKTQQMLYMLQILNTHEPAQSSLTFYFRREMNRRD